VGGGLWDGESISGEDSHPGREGGGEEEAMGVGTSLLSPLR
jgi:hypothetical protein